MLLDESPSVLAVPSNIPDCGASDNSTKSSPSSKQNKGKFSFPRIARRSLSLDHSSGSGKTASLSEDSCHSRISKNDTEDAVDELDAGRLNDYLTDISCVTDPYEADSSNETEFNEATQKRDTVLEEEEVTRSSKDSNTSNNELDPTVTQEGEDSDAAFDEFSRHRDNWDQKYKSTPKNKARRRLSFQQGRQDLTSLNGSNHLPSRRRQVRSKSMSMISSTTGTTSTVRKARSSSMLGTSRRSAVASDDPDALSMARLSNSEPSRRNSMPTLPPSAQMETPPKSILRRHSSYGNDANVQDDDHDSTRETGRRSTVVSRRNTMPHSSSGTNRLDEDDDNTEAEAKPPPRRISFSSVTVRTHDQCLGDHPACHTGPPIQLDWYYRDHKPIEVDSWELHRTLHGRPQGMAFALPSYQRRNRLEFDYGYTRQQTMMACKMAEKDRMRRDITTTLLPMARVEEAGESLKRKVKRVVRRRSSIA